MQSHDHPCPEKIQRTKEDWALALCSSQLRKESEFRTGLVYMCWKHGKPILSSNLGLVHSFQLIPHLASGSWSRCQEDRFGPMQPF